MFRLLILLLPSLFFQANAQPGHILKGKTICLDPGHGGTADTDHYRVGPAGEREEWINLRVAVILKELLRERGARVVMTRETDIAVALEDRARTAHDAGADLFLSIHHNATADSSVNFPIIYFHGHACENLASVELGRQLGQAFRRKLYIQGTPADRLTLASDHTIFPTAGASVLRNTYGIPAVIAEASFFSNPGEERRLKSEAYNRLEAEAYLEAIEAYFSGPGLMIYPKHALVPPIPPFRVFQEAERMTPVARRWKEDFEEALRLLQTAQPDSMQRAYELFTRSASSFPDSYVAQKCHEYRSLLLATWGKTGESEIEAVRAREFYVRVTD